MSLRMAHIEIEGFTGGLNTEASVLDILPSELTTDSVNVELRANGNLRRRRGADFFTDTAPTAIRTGLFVDEAVREAPSVFRASISAPNGTVLNRIIVDLDNKFYIYSESASALGDFSSPLQILSRGNNSHSNQKFYTMQFAQSSDKIFFAGRHTQPGYLQIDDDNSTFTIVYIDVIIRKDAAELGSRVKVPAFSGGRRYPVSPYDDSGFRESEIEDFDTGSDTWYEAIDSHTSSTDTEPGVGADWQKAWKLKRGAVPAGLGAWAGSINYSAAGLIKKYNKNIAATIDETYPVAVEFYQGRLWLGGDPQNPNVVYFSQVILDNSDIEKFHTEADPFDPEDPNVVSDDGGVIELRGSGAVMQLLESGGSMWVATTTNVRGIAGADNVFSATNFSVSTLINEGVNSPHAMTRVGDSFYIFGKHDIWFSGLSGAGLFAKRNIVSVSDAKVQSLYNSIPLRSKAGGRVVYTRNDKKLYYFYTGTWTDFDNQTNSYIQPGYYTDCLVLDTSFNHSNAVGRQRGDTNSEVLGAFYHFTFADTADTGVPYIAAPFASTAPLEIETPVETVSLDTVIDLSNNTVVTNDNSVTGEGIAFLMLQRVTSAPNTTTSAIFGKLQGGTLQDWPSQASYTVSFTSRAVTGVQTADNAMSIKGNPYLFFVLKPTETGVVDGNGADVNPGGCFVRTAWNFSTGVNNSKYSSQTQIYVPNRFGDSGPDALDDDFNAVWYKHRVRGRGHSMQVIFENDGDKDFELVGWGQNFYGKR
jgi:hypothetical protein